MNFDPTLDASSPVISPLKETWPTAWIWFPGQLAAHLHTLVSQRAFRRCAHIGYPGTFYHAEHYVFLRRSVTLVAPLAVRWSAPLGRTRVRINGSEGDITRSQALLPVGKVDLLVSIDMTESLPCFLFDAGPAASRIVGPAADEIIDQQRHRRQTAD